MAPSSGKTRPPEEAQPEHAQPAIRAAGLTKQYAPGSQALGGVDLVVPAGGTTALVGPNGSGKSTLVRLVAGLTAPSGGTIETLGSDPAARDPGVRARTGYVSQEHRFDPEMTGAETLSLLGILHDVPDRSRRIATLAERFGLTAHLDKRLGAYSGGMRRRLQLAAGLLHEPELLLLDEPTADLDPDARAELFRTIAGRAAAGLTTLLVTHDLDEVERCAQQVVVLRDGRVVADAPPETLEAVHGAPMVVLTLPPGRTWDASSATLPAIAAMPGVRAVHHTGRALVVDVDGSGDAVKDVMTALAARVPDVERFDVLQHSLAAAYQRLTRVARDVHKTAERGSAHARASIQMSATRRPFDVRRFAETIGALWTRTWLKIIRRPVTLTFSFVQPVMWLLFFGFLFQRYSVATPGARTYLDFLAPGVCLMTVLFGASQSGIALIRDMESGFLERLMLTPAPPSRILLGKLLADGVRLTVQAIVILGLGALVGARFSLSPAALTPALVAVFLFAFGFSALSCAIALRVRSPESMATFVHVVNMPLLFTSSALVPARQMPDWLAAISRFNPLTLTVDAFRSALLEGRLPDLGSTFAPLLLMTAVSFTLAVRMMRRTSESDGGSTRGRRGKGGQRFPGSGVPRG